LTIDANEAREIAGLNGLNIGGDENNSDDGFVRPSSSPFITKWKTDNSGTSEENQITNPYHE